MASEVGVLDGVRVVEMTVWIAGPSAGGILADWGADVIKVEAPAGDPQRNIFGAIGVDGDLSNPPFDNVNRGKRSVVIDLRTDAGRNAMERLLADADVFLSNMRQKALANFDLDHESVHERHPGVVYCAVSGYGLDGPDADRPGYDIGAFRARAGLARNLAPRDEAPVACRGGLGDHTTGIAAVSGIVGALFERTKTGKGRVVEASLMRTGAYTIAWDLAIQQNMGRLESTKPREMASLPLVNSYRAGDGKWFWLIGLEADRHFPGVARAIDRTDLLTDERFASAKDRRTNREALIVEFDEAFASRELAHWAAEFDVEDVWWAPAQTPAEVLEDPQMIANGAFVEIENPGGDPIKSINNPITFRGNQLEVAAPSPKLGEHSTEVLGGLGLSAEDIAAAAGS